MFTTITTTTTNNKVAVLDKDSVPNIILRILMHNLIYFSHILFIILF